MNWEFIWKYLPMYERAAWLTVQIGFAGIVCAIMLGLICAVVQYEKIPLLKQVAAVYIELSRNTPLLVQLFFIYYGLPKIGIQTDAKTCGIAGLAFLGGSYMAEAFRISLISVVVSIPLGIILGVLMTWKNPLIKAILRIYLEIVRIMPQMVLLFLAFFGTTRAFGWDLSGENASIIVFSFGGTAEMSDLVREEAMQLLERVGLQEKAASFPRELSGGQKQRVAIVRALCMHPEVLLFDEVTAALDPEMIREVLDVILNLAAQGRTMIIVTHEMQFARAVADRVLFLDGGKIIEDEPPRCSLRISGNRCRRRSYSIGSSSIYGYGVPAY